MIHRYILEKNGYAKKIKIKHFHSGEKDLKKQKIKK